MNPEPETLPKTPAATWLGLVVALFGILLARWITARFFPPLSVAIAAGGETLARRFLIGEALIWFCVISLLVIIRLGEGRTLRSVHLGTSPIGKSILWGIIIALLCAVAGAVVGFLAHFQGGELAKGLFQCPLWLVVLVVLTAGVAEELFYRGYAIERLQQLGLNRYLAGGIPLLVFGCAHITNGLANVAIALVLGLILTAVYLWRRDLLANMIGHFLVDFVSVVLPWLALHK
ncbi:MAG: CPBP family intramembrane glutamic endopeptidase [Chthoniobacterales bacterium]